MEPSFGAVLGAGALLSQVTRELRGATDELLAPLELTSQQASLLLRASRGPASPAELAAAVGTDTAGMTRLLDRLENKGLLARTPHPADRRSVVIHLTPRGRALVPSVPPVYGAVGSRLLAGFSDQEISQLTGMINRMVANLRGDRPAAARPSGGAGGVG